MQVHQIAALLASSDPDRQRTGFSHLPAFRTPAYVPVLVHLLQQSDPTVRPVLLSKIRSFGKEAVARALGQLLESDPPHPHSALFYLALVTDPAFNGLLLSTLPRAAASLQVAILHVLSRTADASVRVALAPLAARLHDEAQRAHERLFGGRPPTTEHTENAEWGKSASSDGRASGLGPRASGGQTGAIESQASLSVIARVTTKHTENAEWGKSASSDGRASGLGARASGDQTGAIESQTSLSGIARVTTKHTENAEAKGSTHRGPGHGARDGSPVPVPPFVPRHSREGGNPEVQDFALDRASSSTSMTVGGSGDETNETFSPPVHSQEPRDTSPQIRGSSESSESQLSVSSEGAVVPPSLSPSPAPSPSLRERLEQRKLDRQTAEARGARRARVRGFCGLLLWLAVLVVFVQAAWESAAAPGALRYVTPGALGALLLLCAGSWRRLTNADRAVLSVSALAAVACACAVAPGADFSEAFMLAGRDAGTWSTLVCLASLGLLTIASLAQPAWPALVRVTAVLLSGYCASSFVFALASHVPFSGALAGEADLGQIPWPMLQPPVLFVNGLLPAALFLCTVHWLRGQSLPALRGPAGAALFLVAPFVAGSIVLSTHLIPTPLSVAFGRPVGSGSVSTFYTSPWDVDESGSGKHRVEIVTRGFVPGSRNRTYQIQASVAPAGLAGRSTELYVTVSDLRLGRPIERFQTGDLEVYEDGEKQQIQKMTPIRLSGRTGYRLSYVKTLPPLPAVRLVSPAVGAEVTNVLNIEAEVERPGTRVDLYVDEEPIATFQHGPIRASEPVEAFSAGAHRVRAVLRDRFGRTAEDVREVHMRHWVPDLAVFSPVEGSAVWGEMVVEASVSGVRARQVELVMDDLPIKRFGQGPAAVQIASADLESTGIPAASAIHPGPEKATYATGLDASTLPPGRHRFGVRVVAQDGRVFEKLVTAQVVRPAVEVALTTPRRGERVSGRVELVAEARSSWPELGVLQVEFTAGGKRIATVDRPPFMHVWDTAGWAPGSYEVEAVATGHAGQVGTARSRVELVREARRLELDGLWNGMTVAAPLDLRVVPVDARGETAEQVDLLVDGKAIASSVSAPHGFRLDPALAGDREAVVEARAKMSGGGRLSVLRRVRFAPSERTAVFAAASRHTAPIPLERLEVPAVLVDGRPARDVALSPRGGVATAYDLIVDVSASMASGERQVLLRESISRFLARLAPRDRVAVHAFNDQVKLLRPLTTDRAAVEAALVSVRAYGATALHDAVFEAARYLDQNPATDEAGAVRIERRVIVAVTDGLDQNIDRTGPASARLLPEALDAARRAGVTIHTIGIGRELRQERTLGERVLKAYAFGSGGTYHFAPWDTDLDDAFRNLSRQLACEALVTWRPADNWGRRWHRLSIEWPADSGLTVRTAPGYFGL